MTTNRFKISIIHYHPIEFYPPATNLCDYLGNRGLKIEVHSCHNDKKRQPYSNANIKIKRSYSPKKNESAIIRAFKYLIFNVKTLIALIVSRPTHILYYETISAWPVYIYSKFFNQKCSIFIHYHEYASKDWYNSYMRIVKYFHQIEKFYLYRKAKWISQTNFERLKLFLSDHPSLEPKILREFPNYPPKKWKESITAICKEEQYHYKIVYIGSLAFESTYIKEFCDWIQSQNVFTFDIYSYNLHNDVRNYLKSGLKNINFHEEGIEYSDISKVISDYDVGVIMYKPYSDNVINCVSNKFFEYLACDLDIWYSDIMVSTHPYVTESFYPKVIPVDFSNLNTFNWQQAIHKEDLNYKPSKYFCEEVYKELVEEILKSV